MKSILSIFIILFLFGSVLNPVLAQEEIDTDRPHQGYSAKTLKKGTLQVESGFQFNRIREKNLTIDSILYPATFLRYGILDWLELRVFEQVITTRKTRSDDINRNITGIGNLRAGFKVKLCNQKGALPEFGILVHAIIPTGSVFRRDKVMPELRLLFNNDIGENLQLNYNLGWEGSDEYKMGIGIYTFVVQYKILDSLKVYVENFGIFEGMRDFTNTVDGGLLFLVRPNFQLDLAMGKNFNEALHYYEVGLSFRLP